MKTGSWRPGFPRRHAERLSDLVDNLVRDDSGKIVTADRDRAIDLALKRYGKDRPRSKVEDAAIVAGGRLIALPVGWQADFKEATASRSSSGMVSFCPSSRWRIE